MWELEYVKSGRCAAGDSATYFVAVEVTCQIFRLLLVLSNPQ